MPPRTAAPRQPLGLAQARLEFDGLLRDRVRAMIAASNAEGRDPEAPDPSDTAALLDALARDYADTVDRENTTRQHLAGPPRPLLAYGDAVVVHGAIAVAVEESAYRDNRAFWEATAGGDDVHAVWGRDLLAVLSGEDDEGGAAAELGLA